MKHVMIIPNKIDYSLRLPNMFRIQIKNTYVKRSYIHKGYLTKYIVTVITKYSMISNVSIRNDQLHITSSNICFIHTKRINI